MSPLLDFRAGAARLRNPDMAQARPGRVAIIDIGSNSIRLVVYDGPARLPFTLFNEKVMAGLGAGLAKNGRIGDEAMARGIAALARFRHLCADMGISDIRCVATAAVRDAENGPEFMAQARELGLDVRLLSGRQEGEFAGYGVISSIPTADGIVGDLGGGSLELVRVSDGEVRNAVSLPLGVLRLPAIRARGKSALERQVERALAKAGWDHPDYQGLPFFMVGGSWRSMARLHMYLSNYRLPVMHQYHMAPQDADRMVRVIGHLDKAKLRQVPSLTSARIPTLQDGAALLSVLAKQLGTVRLVVSAHGLREGLLYADLPAEVRAQDPLIAAAELEGDSQGRFPGHGALIDQWIGSLFPDDRPEWRRIRRASCMIADVGWRANPEFRSERGVEFALHGNWVGVDVEGRAMMAQAMHSNFGGGMTVPAVLDGLASPLALRQASLWGLAIRLGQRLSGGVAGPLEHGRLSLESGRLTLCLPERHAGLYGETVEKRLKQLANALEAEAAFEVVG